MLLRPGEIPCRECTAKFSKLCTPLAADRVMFEARRFERRLEAMKFSTTIVQTGANTTGIVVPDAVVEALAAGKRPKVRATIKDHTWRTSLASMGGRFMVGVSAEVRAAAGVAGGDAVD